MANPLVRVYSDLAAAQQAREQLLASGFLSDKVSLTARDDEAGPVEGNFAVGNGAGATRSAGMFGARQRRSASFNSDIYRHDYQTTVQRGNYVLMVEAEAEQERERACDIMDRLGAVDIDRRTAR